MKSLSFTISLIHVNTLVMKSQLCRTVPRAGQMSESGLYLKMRQESEVCFLGTLFTEAKGWKDWL